MEVSNGRTEFRGAASADVAAAPAVIAATTADIPLGSTHAMDGEATQSAPTVQAACCEALRRLGAFGEKVTCIGPEFTLDQLIEECKKGGWAIDSRGECR